jgi:hypothetical protein
MRIFGKRQDGPSGLEADLRAHRPEPRDEFLSSLAGRVGEPERRRPSFARSPRLAFAGAVTAAMLGAVAAFGGFGYAATAVTQAFDSVQQLVAASDEADAVAVRGLSASGDQYQPGYAWGDPSHNHDGPPGLVRQGGEFAPPLQAACRGGTARVQARLVIDEQADLRVSVLDAEGNRLLLVQEGSRVGGDLSGPRARTLRYRLLVPRAFRITLLIPCGLLEEGRIYRIRVAATDPGGETSTIVVPFVGLPATS